MHQFFSKPETLLRLGRGPLGNYLDRYADWLSEQGFCRVHARLQLVQIADFSLWLHKQGLTIIDVQPATIDSFIEDRRRRIKPRAERSTLQRFLKLVSPEVCTQVSPPLTASQVLLHDFRRYFLEERGAAPVSYLTFQPILRQFLSECFPDGKIECTRLTAKDVIGFVRRHAYRHSPGRAKLLITALRAVLRYLCQRGNITSDLAASVPRVAMWPGSTSVGKADNGLRCLCRPTSEKPSSAIFSADVPILRVDACFSVTQRPRLGSPTRELFPL